MGVKKKPPFTKVHTRMIPTRRVHISNSFVANENFSLGQTTTTCVVPPCWRAAGKMSKMAWEKKTDEMKSNKTRPEKKAGKIGRAAFKLCTRQRHERRTPSSDFYWISSFFSSIFSTILFYLISFRSAKIKRFAPDRTLYAIRSTYTQI